MMLHNVNNNHV